MISRAQDSAENKAEDSGNQSREEHGQVGRACGNDIRRGPGGPEDLGGKNDDGERYDHGNCRANKQGDRDNLVELFFTFRSIRARNENR
ncbi:unannotated protein [freshwater metagenome]|uniref:Unannotated protein n=1 Tax=freshwater metagenome TaxID=449393 RepID=A0A6J7G9N4_9ZZZZ